MRIEDIKRLMVKLMQGQPLQMNECSFFIEQYVLDRTEKEIKVNLINDMFFVEPINYAVQYALAYFKVKFNCVTVHNKESHTIMIKMD